MSAEAPDPALAAYLEERSFWLALQGIRPHATYAIGAVALVVFGLETLWGGSDYVATLWRMGANSRQAVLAGEVWRLFSSAFLHIGVFHVAANLWCLWALGPFVEKLLGAPRFLILYALCALCGSLASVAVGRAAFSAGASGAIWGLMAASFALGLRPRALLPPGVAQRARSLGARTLLLNALISMIPGIDIYAHFGGGLAGAALVLSGFSTRGLCRPGEPGSTEARSGGAALRLGAALLSLLMCGSIVLAVVHGRPWDLRHPPAAWRATPLPGTGLVVDVPPGIALVQPPGEPGLFVLGDIQLDSFAVWIRVGPLDPTLAGLTVPAAIGSIREAMAAEQLPKGGSRQGDVTIATLDGRPVVVERLRFPGSTLRAWATICSERLVRVEVVTTDFTAAAWVASVDRFVRSVRPSGTP